jgi:hypothetical protein
MTRITVLIVVLFMSFTVFGSDGLVLISELRTNHADGTEAFSAYTYDFAGNRIDKRIWDGVDSSALLMSRCMYSYDEDNRISREILLDTGNDTLSIVSYAYGSDGAVCIATRRKDGSIRLKDSLFYTEGKLHEWRRYNAADTMTFFHCFGYTGGILTADTLFEPDGAAGFSPTQVRSIGYNSDSTVARESHLRKTGGQWYCITTTVMTYNQKRLQSATTLETEGLTGRLVDSLAYEYDAADRRIKESYFDNERTLIYAIDYTWGLPPWSRIVPDRPMTLYRTAPAYYANGVLRFWAPFTGMVDLYSAGGRRIGSMQLRNVSLTSITPALAAGRYVARCSGTVCQSFTFTIHD